MLSSRSGGGQSISGISVRSAQLTDSDCSRFLVYLTKIIVYSIATDISASKCLVTRYWHERLIKINPRDL